MEQPKAEQPKTDEVRAEKSFVVVGKSVEAALEKAAIVMHCPKERIAYEIMQPPRAGKYGQPGTPAKLRVTPVAPAADALDAEGGVSDEERLLQVTLPMEQEVLARLACSEFLALLEEAQTAEALAAEMPNAEEAVPETGTLREIAGNVGTGTGAVQHVGDLRIHGHVLRGMTVRATGRVHILGNVETAFVDAGGSITVDGGVLGTLRSARGSIGCRFAQGARLEAARGSVGVRESSMHSDLRAGGEVIVGGILLGGACYGEAGVQAQTAGSPGGVATSLMAGCNARLHGEMEQVRARAMRHIERLSECERARLELLPSEEAGTALAAHDRARLWQAAVRRVRLAADLRRLTQQKSRLLGMINEERGSRVCVEGTVYPQVKVSVDDAALEVRAVTQFATFSKDYDSGELRITPLR